MAHLLVVELPGGNDTDLLQAACRRGDTFCFLTARADHYRTQPAVAPWLARAEEVIELPTFEAHAALHDVRQSHARHRFDALLCLIDTRIIESARLAQSLGLRHLNVESAALLRDKYNVRRRLQERGVAQGSFALARSNEELQATVRELGLPLIIKPCDGYASQNIVLLRDETDLDPLLSPLEDLLPCRTDYGLGVVANDRLLVERWLPGRFVGCDTFSAGGKHRILGVHDKLRYDPPSFALRGSTFLVDHLDREVIAQHAFEVLDAVGFDWGAAHLEMMMTPEGPRLVEINPRLVGAKMPRLLDLALGTSVHEQLIALHLGETPAGQPKAAGRIAALRWVVADQVGTLANIRLPAIESALQDCSIGQVEVLKRPGDCVRPPLENVDRLGYVMTSGPQRQAVEALAERFVADAVVSYREDAVAG